jgi:hypothetical protein
MNNRGVFLQNSGGGKAAITGSAGVWIHPLRQFDWRCIPHCEILTSS